MAKSTKNTKFSTKASKTPKDHLPAEDQYIEIETTEGLLRVKPISMTAGDILWGDDDVSEKQITKEMIVKNADPEALELIKKLNSFGEESEFYEVMEFWQKASGLDLGESSASSN